jgi:hypothetical protein
MNVLYAVAGLYWVCFVTSFVGIGGLLYQLSPRWAPVIVIPATLAFLAKKGLEYYIVTRKQAALSNAFETYQKQQADAAFNQDVNDKFMN